MAPKQITLTPEQQAVAQQLRDIVGLDEKNSNDLATKPERAEGALQLFKTLSVSASSATGTKTFLYGIFTRVKNEAHHETVGTYVANGKMQLKAQVDAAVLYVNKLADDATIDVAEFEKIAGIGQVVSADAVPALVKAQLTKDFPELSALAALWAQQNGRGRLLGQLRGAASLKWAEIEAVKAALETTVPEMTQGIEVHADPAAEKPKAAAKAATKDKKAEEPSNWAMVEDWNKVGEGAARIHIGDVAQAAAGTEVFVKGWAHQVRHQARMSFVELRDGTGYVQVVFPGKIPHFARETSLTITAKVKDEAKAAKGLLPPKELSVVSWAIIGASDPDFEHIITHESSVDKLLDQRHLVLRGTNAAATMQIRSLLLQAFREFFWSQKMMEIAPPTLVQTECEGGSSVFEVDYYGEKSFLTQSSQLYLETAITSVGDVFCILPSYRAEKAKTRRHLAEYTHIESEFANITFEDLLVHIETLICHTFDKTVERAGHLAATVNPDALKDPKGNPRDPENWKLRPKAPFKRLRYADAIKFCNEHGILNPETGKDYVFGEDISDAPEREMIAKIGETTLMTHFPASMKSFYMSRTEGDLTESVDVLVPGVGEVVGGSMRMWNHEELMNSYKKQGYDPSSYYWYTEQRKYGSVPHGGYGLGLERMLAWMLNLYSVKDACLFPRYMGRCVP